MAKVKYTIKISLTDFIDFVSRAGKSKQTKVKQIKERDPYHPVTDFYKPLREGIIDIHRTGGTKPDLDGLLKGLTDEKKKRNYPIAIAGYKKFWGRKSLKWFEPPFSHWQVGDVDIKVNPELGLECDGKFWVIKLYLKADPLTKDKIGQILSLMEDQLRKKAPDDEILFCVLDVKNSKLFCNEDKDTSMLPLLKGEVLSLETIWKSI